MALRRRFISYAAVLILVMIALTQQGHLLGQSKLTRVTLGEDAPETNSTTEVTVAKTNKYRWLQVPSNGLRHSRKSLTKSPIVIEDYKLVFITMPKVGSSLFKMLFRRMMGYQDYNKPNPHQPEGNGLKYLSQYKRDNATFFMNDPSITRAVFVRDPKSRFLSAYLNKGLGEGGYFFKVKCCLPLQKSKNPLYTVEECMSIGRSSLTGFFNMTRHCRNDHWGLQAQRIDHRFWRKVNFVGHLETIEQDTRRLLEQLGAWEQFGASGWGPHSNESIFASTGNVQHATHQDISTIQDKNASWHQHMARYYTPELEREVDERFKADYQTRKFRLVPRPIDFSYNPLNASRGI